MDQKITYFGYGSNIWLEQMRKRCPESQFIGVGILSGWKWIINSRGYANIIPSEDDIVYGFIFKLTQADEQKLDKFEGKEYERVNDIQVELVKVKDSYKKGTVTALVYIDIERKKNDVPKDEYVDRINMAIKDGLKEGIPKKYFDKYIRPFVPER